MTSMKRVIAMSIRPPKYPDQRADRHAERDDDDLSAEADQHGHARAVDHADSTSRPS